MAALNDKKIDKKQRKLEAQRAEEEKKQKENRKWKIGGSLIAFVIAALLIFNSSLVYNNVGSVKVGSTSYTNAEFQYYYYTSYYNFAETYSSFLSYLIDTSSPLSSQTCSFDSEMTWAEYFEETALSTMQSVTSIYDDAMANGYELSEEYTAAIETDIETVTGYATAYGYSNIDDYLVALYGRGSSEELLREILYMNYLADEYSYSVYEAFAVETSDIDAWYEENKDTYDTFTYSYFNFSAETVEVEVETTDETTGVVSVTTEYQTTDETMAEAKAGAEDIIAQVTDEMSLAAVIEGMGGSLFEAEGISGSSIDSTYSEWLMDDVRVAGDMTVIEVEGSGYYIVMFGGRDDNQYNTVSARHILITAYDADEDGAYSEEEIALAYDAILEIQAEYEAGEMTEEAFAALAEIYSEDTGSNTNGGLYETIYKGQMVDGFEDFVFSSEAGEVGIVYNDGTYTGYHLVYALGEDDMTYHDYLGDVTLRNEMYTEWSTALLEGYETSTNILLKMAAI